MRDAETDAPTCETCAEEIPWGGRGRRPRWCVEHRAAGRAAAAKARLAASRPGAPEEAREEAEDEAAPEGHEEEAAEAQAQAEAEEPEASSASEGEAQAEGPGGLPEAVELLRRALPRQARGAFVAGYLLGRGVL